jgi:hypothetical protein
MSDHAPADVARAHADDALADIAAHLAEATRIGLTAPGIAPADTEFLRAKAGRFDEIAATLRKQAQQRMRR